jgi:hypothetical protein
MTEIQMDPEETSSRSSLHLEQYSEAELALLREIEAEKMSKNRRNVSFDNQRASFRPTSAAGFSEVGDTKEQRAKFAQFRRDLDARYASESSERGLVSFDEYRAEQSRRLQAEELAAAMAARAKDGLEKRNKEIMNLKIELCTVADEKESEILRLRNQLHSLKRESLSKT